MSLDKKYLLFSIVSLVGLPSFDQVLLGRFSEDLDDQKQVILADYWNLYASEYLTFLHSNCYFIQEIINITIFNLTINPRENS